jgi:hypothetical protein
MPRGGLLSRAAAYRAEPWASLRSPADLTASAMRVLVPLMETRTIQRLAVISAGGVGDSRRQLSWSVQKLVAAGNIGVAYRDLAAMEDVLSASSLDWLAVRPVTLVNGAPTGRAGAVDRYGLLSTVRRADVAQWLLDAVEAPPPFRPRRVLLGASRFDGSRPMWSVRHGAAVDGIEPVICAPSGSGTSRPPTPSLSGRPGTPRFAAPHCGGRQLLGRPRVRT